MQIAVTFRLFVLMCSLHATISSLTRYNLLLLGNRIFNKEYILSRPEAEEVYAREQSDRKLYLEELVNKVEQNKKSKLQQAFRFYWMILNPEYLAYKCFIKLPKLLLGKRGKPTPKQELKQAQCSLMTDELCSRDVEQNRRTCATAFEHSYFREHLKWQFHEVAQPECACNNRIICEHPSAVILSEKDRRRCMLTCDATHMDDKSKRKKPFPVYLSATAAYNAKSKRLINFVFHSPYLNHKVVIMALLMHKRIED